MLLEIENLKTYYEVDGSYCRAVDGVSLSMDSGENIGLIGESGCGKTTVIKSILKLLPKNGVIQGGSIRFLGKDLVTTDEKDMRKIRWRKISLIPQSAMNSLNPVYRVGDLVGEAIKIHKKIERKELKKTVEGLFELVGLEREKTVAYPHQLSGGMKQRVLIAMALALEPDLIIADEPTTALDVIMQDRILEELVELQKKFHNSILYVSHDISVVAQVCDKVAVMYAGKLVEYGSVFDVFDKPFHPYTMGLKRSFPSLKSSKPLLSLPGKPPNLLIEQKGCRFKGRCPFSIDVCWEKEPGTIAVNKGHLVSCYRHDEAGKIREIADEDETWQKVKEVC